MSAQVEYSNRAVKSSLCVNSRVRIIRNVSVRLRPMRSMQMDLFSLYQAVQMDLFSLYQAAS
jgi:hypothetical protein